MLTSDVIWKFGTVSFAIVIAPGASWAYVISSTTRGGLKNGLQAVAGNGTGILIHATVAALGLTTLLQWSSDSVLQILRWLGAAYLCFLACRTLRQAFLEDSIETEHELSAARTFRDGVLVNVLNPKVMLLMIALLPQFLRPERGRIPWQIFQLGLVHAFLATTLLSGLALITSLATKPNHQKSGRLRFGLRLVSALVLMVCGLGMLADF